MAFHHGSTYQDGPISIGAPDPEQVLQADIADDVMGALAHYLVTARKQANEYYFCIYEDKTPVGQIVLHDMNTTTGESLIGYCLFRPELRGRGIGTKALRLLQQFVVAETSLIRLIIITDNENLASQTIARKCGFQFIGNAREAPEQLMVFEWVVSGENRGFADSADSSHHP